MIYLDQRTAESVEKTVESRTKRIHDFLDKSFGSPRLVSTRRERFCQVSLSRLPERDVQLYWQ